MSKLVQIIYISRASAAPTKSGNAVDPVVARILAKSRANNRKNGLVGVLYFGDGCFFQCLEGDEAAVNTLYAKLEQDERHRDLKIISRTTIAAPTFKDWSMKYVPIEQDMAALLRRHRLASFDPYQFTPAMTADLIELLHKTPEPMPEPVVPSKNRKAPAGIRGETVTARSRLPLVLIGLVSLAVIGGLLAIMMRSSG
ncbi:BLUF domain-containing protein [Massilia sp. CF038]|uniref:BLUF domain-containing protein n=1 Tax=Massilia sp. CF038 TaxID=1881045 RepID=UPI0009214476|nr:BLUF domain-containing protein [Massilia sp. CF038]SHH06017.1 Sensors of blue-light using FAD [Massilia sp. CF038]